MRFPAASSTVESGAVNKSAGRGTYFCGLLLARFGALHPAGFTAGRVFLGECFGAHMANVNLAESPVYQGRRASIHHPM